MNNIFTDTRLRSEIRQGLAKIGFTKPTPVQEKVIPAMLKGESVIVQAATGSGKTHAYLIPILNAIDEDARYVQAIVTAPSRELADQLYRVARQLRDNSGLNIAIAHLAGGSDRDRQIARFEQNKPQLVIATPGRLLDFADKKILLLDQVKNFVIDEADMTLDLGFLADVDKIAARLPKDVVMSAFSATIPVKLTNFLRKYMAKPEEIVIDNPAVIAPTIKNDLLDIGSKDRKKIVYKLLTMGQPYLSLVFANTKQMVDELADYLTKQGLKVAKIHGSITERERKRTLREVRAGQYQYVVASDLAARGIDLPGVSLVINYEIPKDLEFIIHRIGRTGRNGLPGHAVTLVREEEMNRVGALEYMGVHFDFVEIKDGALAPRTHYRRRDNRTAANRQLDPHMKGVVKKIKSKRKPGYKKKIKQAIQEDNRKKRKIEARHEMRHQKHLRKRKREQKR
ncbi:DEAD/DEAH box helicase [Lactobacillus delbrueckii subsp. bulgaricus]|uniref:DEAD/DEAH box helicase n=1 Tax=Lactobacillus delbrueckii TaxID=1584 RepID=UPI001594271E|nr:DEAD/DEAH box helicase [Lactobacillus delbrueckii]NVH29355.1 DEAD/DEAH box helicase [Lactobacillus delbrueckii subsp. bulgaricus]NWO30920.1 DEAD/DEAH box helicase [Lactobacillus delbrueckii subsp. bulgaricus]